MPAQEQCDKRAVHTDITLKIVERDVKPQHTYNNVCIACLEKNYKYIVYRNVIMEKISISLSLFVC